MNQLNIKEKYREAAEKIKKFAQTRKGKIVLSTSACALVALIITGVVASGITQSSDKVAGSQKEAAVSDSSSVSSGSEASSAASGTSSATVSSASSAGASSSSTGTSAAPSAAQTAAVAVTSVDFNRRSLSLTVGATAQITANITPANATDKALSWTSTNSSIATVDGNGNIKAVGAGTAYVRATNSDGQRDTCTVTVSSGSTGGSGNAGGSTGGGSGNTGGSTGDTGGSSTGNSGSTGGSGTGGSTGGGGASGGTTVSTANYQGVNETKYYTDEITGVSQKIEFGGVGAGYREVAFAGISITVPSDLAQKHLGFGTISVTGSNGFNQSGTTGASGATMTIANLTAGTYTVTQTAHDGTVTAKIHFTVDSKGNVS